MIDWSKLAPANAPTPSTPNTTTPVAPFAPGSIPNMVPPAKPYEFGTGYHEATQEQVDHGMDFGQRIGRGIDHLGNMLFGQGNGSPLGGVPLLGDIVGAGGNVLHSVADGSLIKPVEAAATVASRVPLGWLPGGADDAFNKLGEWAKTNDPKVYAQWQMVNAAAGKDVLDGGNMKADFNMEMAKYLDDQQHDSSLGTTPEIAMGREAIGSAGGAISEAIKGFLGLAGNTSQRILGGSGIFNPEGQGASFDQMLAKYKHPDAYTEAAAPSDSATYAFQQMDAGKFTEQQARDYVAEQATRNNRVQEAMARFDRGGEVSDVEKHAVEAVRSGAWSMDHGQDYIVSHGQGITRNPVGQIIGSVATDPLTLATIGAGGIAKVGELGAQIGGGALGAGYKSLSTAEKLAFAAEQEGVYQKLATTVAAVQKDPFLGPISRIARGLIDPLGVYKPSTVAKATTDMLDTMSVAAVGRAYGRFAQKDVEAIGREFGMQYEVKSAIASYAKDQGRQMIARHVQSSMLEEGLGIELSHANVDEVVDPIAQMASRDAMDQLTDHIYSTAKNTFTPEEEANLAGRMAATFGNDVAYWEKRLATMPFETRSLLHAITYKRAEVAFAQAHAAVDAASYQGDLPLRNMVLMSSETLDNVKTEAIIENIRAALKNDAKAIEDPIATATSEWNAQARRYPAMANLGFATGGQEQVTALVKELEKKLQSGGISRRALDAELSDPALQPIRDMLDRNMSQTGEPLWHVGFRPDESVSWGLKQDVNTGRPMIDRDPTISHVVDAVPGRQPFSDTTRNVLGQIIGTSKAERLNAPIDSIEAFVNTLRDSVSGRRLVANIERRFERSTFDAGIPKPISKEIFSKAREVAGLDYTTVRGIKPDNLWNSIHEVIPRDLVLTDGSKLNIHIVMDHLLKAAEGDLRIMGVTSVLSQRMRNALRAKGDAANWAGQMTVTMYNKLRYSQPMFLIQRITDAPYYSILYGVKPVGGGALTGANAELRAIEDNLGRTGFARDFSMDMPEYATRTNFTAGIKSKMQEMGLLENKLDKILRAPDTVIANNMTNMLHANLGDIVRGALDNLATAAEKDPALKAEMLAAGDTLTRSFEDWRRAYSEAAGKTLNDNEVGLRYLQDQLNAWRRHVVNADGTLDFSRLVAEGERSMPSDIADIGTIRPDILAQELGYTDSAALRRDVTGHMERINGDFVLVKGEHDVPWLEEQLRTQFSAHPDYTRRALAYYGDTWDGFWHKLSKGVDQGGLDISAHYAKEAQDLISLWARDRGMDPWEYLSGVMASNIGAKDLQTHMGQLMGFLKAGKAKQPLEEWSKVFRGTLDVSAQKELLKEFEAAVPIEDVIKVPTPGAFGKDHSGNSVMPAGFAVEPGYVYRTDVLAKMRGGWRSGEGVTTDTAQLRHQVAGRDGEGIFRSKIDESNLNTGRNAAKQPGGKDRLTKGAVPPEQIEMLDQGGNWVPLGADPMDTIMAKDFPEMVRQRIISGTPHANPEVEGYIEQFSKWVSDSISGELGSRTRADLRRLVEQVPTAQATSFNRSHALVVSLLKNKIEESQRDIFRLAEMQTKRTVLERSLNHPLFGLYPASYMWGKVLPETVKFLAKNPYAATYAIGDVQRAIAIQREFDPGMDQKVGSVDRSAGAFLLDYLTPGLPWSDHQARQSPLVRDLFAGKDLGAMFKDELDTISPQRWVKQVVSSLNEIPGAVESLQAPAAPPSGSTGDMLSQLAGAPSAPATGPTGPVEITGPTKASALAPILADDLSRLQSIFAPTGK